jgi:hypothetical protein
VASELPRPAFQQYEPLPILWPKPFAGLRRQQKFHVRNSRFASGLSGGRIPSIEAVPVPDILTCHITEGYTSTKLLDLVDNASTDTLWFMIPTLHTAELATFM